MYLYQCVDLRWLLYNDICFSPPPQLSYEEAVRVATMNLSGPCVRYSKYEIKNDFSQMLLNYHLFKLSQNNFASSFLAS